MLKSTMKKMLVCASLTLMAAGTANAAGTLKIGTEGGYPPWSMVDANGQVSGFDADIGNALCKALDVRCRFVVQAFDSLIPSLDAERFDLIMSGMSVTPERGKRILFSIPYAVEDSVFVLPAAGDLTHAKDAKALLAGLSGKVIGVQAGTTHGDFLRKQNPDIQIKAYDTLDQMQIDLDGGRLYGTFADAYSQSTFLKKAGTKSFVLSDLIIKSSMDPATLGYGIGVGINKKNPDLKARVDKALCELINDGTVTASSQKWFGIDIANHETCKN